MESLKSELLSIFSNHSEIEKLTEGRIGPVGEFDTGDMPCITYFEVSNVLADFRDNMPKYDMITMQIDIYCKKSTTELANYVDQVLLDNKYFRNYSKEHTDNEAGYNQKIMRFKKKVKRR